MIEKELQKIGLSIGESKAYLSMIELGSSTVGPIAKKSGISYSKIYEVLQRLIEKGFASFIIKEKTKYFQAVEPRNLHNYLDKQKQKLEETRKNLERIIPQLEQYKDSSEKQEAEIFIGLKGLRTAYENMYLDYNKKDIALFFYVHKKEYSEIVDNFFLTMVPFYKKNKIKFNGIGSKEWAKSEYVKKTSNFINAKYVDFPLPGTIDIYKNMILEVAWSNKPTGILIHSKEIADNYRNYFNEVWKMAKK